MLATFINAMSIQQIILTCQQIQQSGKKPSTALVKAKLGASVPLATVIKGLQMYNANPEIELLATPPNFAKNNEVAAPDYEAEVKLLKKHIVLLEDTIIGLQAEVAALMKQ